VAALGAAVFGISPGPAPAQDAAPRATRPAAAPPQTVIDIRVEGNERMTAGAILVHVKTRVGQRYDAGVVRADQQRLLRTGRFDNVVVRKTQTDQGVIVTFEVSERPTIVSVGFRRNKAFKDDELAKALSFGPGSPLQSYLVEKGRREVLEKYRQAGYFFADVKADPRAYRDRAEVIYDIVEGPRVRIRKVRFEGNDFFSTLRLKMDVATQARFWPFIAGTMDAEQIERDVHTIRNRYIEEGFLDAEVGRKLRFNDDKTRVTVTFVIHEGPRYRVDEIRVVGNKVFTDEELIARLKLEPGDFFTGLTSRRDARRLEEVYGKLGYIDAAVKTKRRFKETPGVVDVVFEIAESDQYRVGRIVVRGNTVTQSRVILRELSFYPEQLFDMVAVDQSRQRLLETQLFEEVAITPTGTAPGVRDAVVSIKEGRTAQFLVGVGASSQEGLLGNIELTQRNFDLFGPPRSWRDVTEGRAWKGAGQILRLSAEPGTELMRFYIEWLEPYLFDRPYSLGTRAYLFTRGREDYFETRYGGFVSFGHRFKNRWYGELATRIEGIEVSDLDFDAPPEVRQVAGTTALAGLSGSLTRNRTDSRWLPSTGDVIRLNYEQVTGDFDFGRLGAEYKIYRTVYVDALDRKHILSGRAAVGQILGDAPVFERFYGGGTGSVRGFAYRGISPRSAGTDKPVGGDFNAFVGGEYTFPLIAEVIRGVVFLDSGTVEENFEVTTWRASAGFGVRWHIPFFGPVPFRLDFGFPLNKHDEDDTQVFSFTFGWTF
jgi:outer membrane protein insertion porin family